MPSRREDLGFCALSMTESVHFHTDLYRRDALELAAEKYHGAARIELVDSGTSIVARVRGLAAEEDRQTLLDEFCSEAFSATARQLRTLSANGAHGHEQRRAESDAPPWGLLAPFTDGGPLALGWVLESLSPIRGGATTMVLRHERHGVARIAIRRNSGAPLGVAHTDTWTSC